MNSKIYFAICTFFLSLLACFGSSIVSAQSTKHYVDSLANDFLVRNHSSCIVIGIIDHGKQKIYCYGTINKNGGLPADSNTLFEIGSLTKLFTATTAAIDVHEGKLKYSDSLSTFLQGIHVPEFEGHEIKVIDLLHHTSGLPRIPSDLFTIKDFDSINPYKTYSRAILDTFISKCRLQWLPGTSYSYSNLGYGLMGDILSGIESMPYETIIRKKIWSPLNMNQTTITLSDNQRRIMASPYKENGSPDHNWDYEALAGAGAIRSNINDMMKFLNASMNPENIKDDKLKHAMIDCQTMTFNADNGIQVGLGWHLEPFNFNKLYDHTGETGGYYSFIGFTKEDQKGLVILTNSQASTNEMAFKILEMHSLKN